MKSRLLLSKILKKGLIILGIFGVLLLGLYLLRYPILRGIGGYLIYENESGKSEVLFLLSGGPNDRAVEAYKVWEKGDCKKIVCTGETVPRLLHLLDIDINEAELSKIALINLGMPDSLIEIISAGTSTREESEIILDYCHKNELDKAFVLSDKFHTRRIHYAFKEKFQKQGVQLILRGAASSVYEEDNWWLYENGLLMVNNEYVKLMYYMIYY